jgi:hypothetical protein
MGGYTYSVVESALAAVLGIPEDARGALRGRLKHLQTCGLSAGSPGKGTRIEYDDEAVIRWLLALRFENLGLDPRAIATFIVENWEHRPGREFPKTPLKEVVDKARDAMDPDDQKPSDHVWLTVTFNYLPGKRAFPMVGYIHPLLKPKKNPKLDNAGGFFQNSEKDVADRVVIPLTKLLRVLDTELKSAIQQNPKGRDGE